MVSVCGHMVIYCFKTIFCCCSPINSHFICISIRMATRRASICIRRLTQREIDELIETNFDSDNEVVDEATDSESDFTEHPDPESSENETDEHIDEEVGEHLMYIGRNGTEWQQAALDFLESLNSSRYNRPRLGKVHIPPGKYLDSAFDCLALILDEEIIDIIVQYTNIEGNKRCNNNWKATSRCEIYSFIGLLITGGLSRHSRRDYAELWHPWRGSAIYRATMSANRFGQLLRFLRFDDKNTRTARRSKAKFALIRDIFDRTIHNMKKSYSPNG